jgi:hypothetical protein
MAEWAAPAIPAAALALMPKCPACVAAYVALGTGLGISLTTAAHIRTALIILFVAALAIVAARQLRSFQRARKEA